MNKLHVLALYGANDVCLGVSMNNNHAGAKQRISLPRTEENVAFVEKVKCAVNAHDTLVAALLQAESALHARLPNSTAMTEVLAALKSIGIEPQHKSASLPGLA